MSSGIRKVGIRPNIKNYYNGSLFRLTISGTSSYVTNYHYVKGGMVNDTNTNLNSITNYKVRLWDGSYTPLANSVTETNISLSQGSGNRTLDIIPCDSLGNPTGRVVFAEIYGIKVESFELVNQINGLFTLRFVGCDLESFGTFSGNSNLQHLYLFNNKISSFDGTGFGNLATLSISNNNLTSTPTGLSFGLNNFNISNNPINYLNTSILPTSIILLSAHNCQLSGSIDIGRFNQNYPFGLQTLGISNNNLTSITGTFSKYLNDVNIYGNQFDANEIDSILIRLEVATSTYSSPQSKWFYGNLNIRTSASDVAYNALVSRGWNMYSM
jgi:hypothetical protein